MGCGQNLQFTPRLDRCSIYVLFLLISFSTHLRLIAEGRPLLKPVPTQSQEVVVKEEGEKAIVRQKQQIGSMPPRCERKCSSCGGHCEAIQVPTNPNIKDGINAANTTTTTTTTIVATIASSYSRGDDYSNYKPMSWKCKCGNFIFNP